MKRHTCRVLFVPLLLITAGMVADKAQAGTGSLDWLAGSWCMAADGQSVEEVWLPEAGGQLIGLSRTIADGKVVAFEFLRIEIRDGTTQYIAQPGGGSATVFTASRAAENELVVENPQHDFPQKITYSRVGNALTATISGPGDDGQEQSFNYNYLTCKD